MDSLNTAEVHITVGHHELGSITESGDGPSYECDLDCDCVSPDLVPQRRESPLDSYAEHVQEWFIHRNTLTLQGALAFVPWLLQDVFYEKQKLPEDRVVLTRCTGALLLTDAGGFSELTTTLNHHKHGAELLSHSLQAFFTPLIDLITAYRGDVIKFGGDSLTVFFPAVDDTRVSHGGVSVPPHGSYGLPDLGPMSTAVLRASACSIEIHKKLTKYDTAVGNSPSVVTLSLHIGISCGEVALLQLGGVAPPESASVPRFEYVLAGHALEELNVAKNLAKLGETVVTQKAWMCISECVVEGSSVEGMPDFHRLLRLNESRYTYPTIKRASIAKDRRGETQFQISELDIIRRYIPPHVFKRIECGTLTYVNEMRKVTVVFVSINGFDVSTDEGCQRLQDCVAGLQSAIYAYEGTFNKFLYDEDAMVLLAVFGLPPLVHVDDPTRAVLACFDMARCLEQIGMEYRFGVTTGRSYCGVCGCASRMEYTVLGDQVNLASTLMELRARGPGMTIICDENTKKGVSSEIVMCEIAPVRIKKRTKAVAVYIPERKEFAPRIGLTRYGKIHFPWYDHPHGGCSLISISTQELKQNVRELGGLTAWEGIQLVTKALGSSFSADIHDDSRLIMWESPTAKAPEGTPFEHGGVIVMEGPTGSGKIELAEHIVIHAALHFQVMPIFGSMGPRPRGSKRLACELLRSTLNVYRNMDQDEIPRGDMDALWQLVPEMTERYMPILGPILTTDSSRSLKDDEQCIALKVVVALLVGIVSRTPVLICMQFEHGSNLYPKTVQADMDVFEKAVIALHDFANQQKSEGNTFPITLLVIARGINPDNSTVRAAKLNDTLLVMRGLSNQSTVEYMGYCLGVAEQIVPLKLTEFVIEVTGGIPLYIRETLNQLQESGHLIKVLGNDNRTVKGLQCKDMDQVDIASWQNSSMVGMTVCKIESLDPLPSAVLKMSTCFQGAFTLADLAASACSPWADASNLDNICLYHALRILLREGFIEEVETPVPCKNAEDVDPRTCLALDTEVPRTQYFQTRNFLIRAVGSSRVLEAQRNSVKRQALIDRVLVRKLPKRMEALQKQRNAVHVPWYYQQGWQKMGDWQPPPRTHLAS